MCINLFILFHSLRYNVRHPCFEWTMWYEYDGKETQKYYECGNLVNEQLKVYKLVKDILTNK